MKKNLFFIGLDISEADFAASIYKTPGQPIVTKEAIPNDRKGFKMLLLWLNDYITLIRKIAVSVWKPPVSILKL